VTMASVAAAAVAECFPEGGTPWQVRKVYEIVSNLAIITVTPVRK
jgi:hypothetical protein